MNKVLMPLLFGAFVLSGISFAQTPPPAQESTVAAPQTMRPAMYREHKADRHPEIHRAMRKLRGAKSDLEKAAHDYAGHKAKAIRSINEALEELRAAIAADPDRK